MRTRLWLVLSLLVSATTWFYMHRVLMPWKQSIEIKSGKLKAQMGDLYPRWVGTRELLLHGRNPYGPEVSHEIQMAFYGHAITQKYGDPGVKLIDEQRFVYPVYVVFLLAPTIRADFAQLQFWTPVLLVVLTAISVLLWLDVLRWRPSWMVTVALVLFVLCSPQIVQGVEHSQLALAVGFLLALSAWCVVRNHLAIAGAVLALSTIKPQMVILSLAWFLLWALGDWPKRLRLLAGFFGTMIALIAAGEVIFPGWLGYFFEGLRAYQNYFPTMSLAELALGDRFGKAVGLVVIAGLLAFAWRKRNAPADSPQFSFTLTAFFLATAIVLPLLTPFNQVLLILPALMLVRDWATLPRLARIIFTAIIGWPWLAALGLLLRPPRLDAPGRLPLLPSVLVLFVPILLLVLLMMRRVRIHQS